MKFNKAETILERAGYLLEDDDSEYEHYEEPEYDEPEYGHKWVPEDIEIYDADEEIAGSRYNGDDGSYEREYEEKSEEEVTTEFQAVADEMKKFCEDELKDEFEKTFVDETPDVEVLLSDPHFYDESVSADITVVFHNDVYIDDADIFGACEIIMEDFVDNNRGDGIEKPNLYIRSRNEQERMIVVRIAEQYKWEKESKDEND